MWRSGVLGFALVALVGCDSRPTIPPLPGPASDPVENVVLDDQFSPSDIRTLFRAINRNGKLDGLAPWLDPKSDATLERFARIVDRTLFRQAYHPHGLIAVLKARTHSPAVSQLVQWTRERNPDEHQVLHAGFFDPRVPEIARQQRRWLEPRAHGIWTTFPSDLPPWPQSPAPLPQWLPDVAKLLAQPTAWESVASTVTGWLDHRLFPSLIAGVRHAKADKPSSLVGASLGLAQLAQNDSLEQVLGLMAQLNQPSGGLFTELETTLVKSPHLVQEFGKRIEPYLALAVGGLVAESLRKPPVGGPFDRGFWNQLRQRDLKKIPSPQWIQLFTAIRTAVEKLTGGPGGGFAADGVLRSLPLYLNSYALTLWVERTVKENWPVLRDSRDFSSKLWSASLKSTPWTLELAETDAQGDWVLTPAAKRDFQALGLGDFLVELEQLIPRQGFGEFYYEVGEVSGAFGELLGESCRAIHQSRAFGDPTPWLQALVYGVTRDKGGFGFRLRELETSNLAVGLHGFLSQLTPSSWDRVSHILFEQIGLGSLTSEDSQFLLSLYDGHPQLQQRVEDILKLLPSLQAFHESIEGQPSPMALYLRVLRHIPRHSLSAWMKTWETVHSLQVTNPKAYPELVGLLKNGRPVAQALNSLAGIPSSDQSYVADLMESSLRGTGLQNLWDWGKSQLPRNPSAWGQILEDLPSGWTLTEAERRWLIRFFEGGEFEDIWTLLGETPRKDAIRLVSRLRTLAASGELTEALQLLALVQDPEIAETARVGLDWIRSGQLPVVLDGILHWLER